MENKATEGVNLKQNMEDDDLLHDQEKFSVEKTVEGLLNESVGKFTENLENLENPYSNTLENTSDTLVDTNDTLVDHSDTLENPDDDELDEVPGDNNFNDIIDKVDYITDKNFNELVNILMNDNALSTMLIDMINRNKYGNKYPSIMTKKNSNDTKSPKTFLYTNSYSSDEPKHNYEDDYEDDRERERFCSIS